MTRGGLMLTASAVLGLTAVGPGCARSARSPRPPGPVASALVATAADLGAAPEAVASAWVKLEALVARVEARHRETHGDPIDDLNAVVFDELGFERVIDSDEVRFFDLASVVEERRGTCLGLGALYLALGERLGVALDGVMVPGHFFVRSRGARPRNVELLRRGEAMPDAWYRAKYGPWPADSAYGRPVSVAELIGLHWYNAGNHLRAARDLPAAERAYARAAEAFPAFAEAQANLGAVRQLSGALGDAETAYGNAARARADLPGLAHNVALLKQEQRLESTQTRRESP